MLLTSFPPPSFFLCQSPCLSRRFTLLSFSFPHSSILISPYPASFTHKIPPLLSYCQLLMTQSPQIDALNQWHYLPPIRRLCNPRLVITQRPSGGCHHSLLPLLPSTAVQPFPSALSLIHPECSCPKTTLHITQSLTYKSFLLSDSLPLITQRPLNKGDDLSLPPLYHAPKTFPRNSTFQNNLPCRFAPAHHSAAPLQGRRPLQAAVRSVRDDQHALLAQGARRPQDAVQSLRGALVPEQGPLGLDRGGAAGN